MAAVVKFPVVKTAVVAPSVTVALGVVPVARDRQDSGEASDLKLIDFANGFDIQLGVDGDFDLIAGFDTALLISILAEMRASEDERIASITRRGWLGNESSDIVGFEIGSKVWLFYQARLNSTTLNGIKDKARLGLQWMIDQGFASSVEVASTRLSKSSAGLTIQVARPNGDITVRSIKLWDASPDT